MMQSGSSATGNMKLRQHYEGQLSKYTNVVKGWQFRWFVLNPDKGTLDYYMSEHEMTVDLAQFKRPRGTLHLAGAVISPSEEDSHTFVVNPASGEQFKLRAVDAKERQEWITRLRITAELHSQALSQTNSPLVSRDHGSATRAVVPCNLTVLDAFGHVREWLQKADQNCQEMTSMVDQFPISGHGTKSTDQDLLALRATSITTLGCLEECLYALQLEQRSLVKPNHISSSAPAPPPPQQPPPPPPTAISTGLFNSTSSTSQSNSSSTNSPGNTFSTNNPNFPNNT